MNCGIYKVENLINHKVYIGKSIDIDNRWDAHKKNYKSARKAERDKVLYKAMRKHGLENFSFEIIELCSIDEVSEREKYYIEKYDCCLLDGTNKGYNMTRGGDGNLQIDYKKILNLWNEGLTQKEICARLNIAESTVIRALNYYEISSLDRHHRGGCQTKNRKPVLQYNSNLELVKKYTSIKEAYRETGINTKSIADTCKHRQSQAGGYIWLFESETSN